MDDLYVDEPERTSPAPLGVDGFVHPDARVQRAKARWLGDRGGRLAARRSSRHQQMNRAPRSKRRTRPARRNAATAASSPRGPDRPPRLCACGCGKPVPAGRRKYASDPCENRAAQRRWRERHRVDPSEAAGREADLELVRYERRHSEVVREAAGLAGIRARVEELAERRLEIYLALPYANGNGAALRVELDQVTRAIADGWESVRLEAVAK